MAFSAAGGVAALAGLEAGVGWRPTVADAVVALVRTPCSSRVSFALAPGRDGREGFGRFFQDRLLP